MCIIFCYIFRVEDAVIRYLNRKNADDDANDQTAGGDAPGEAANK